ncbi:MAG: hypothetical protein IJ769_07745 [Clostridia bacterium]|nr:hypothetical protein [Clostridia bacterium]
MIRALCKNQTFMLRALDGSTMFTKPNKVNEISEKFTNDPTYKMAVKAGALEPFKTEKEAQKKADANKNSQDKKNNAGNGADNQDDGKKDNGKDDAK